MNGINAVSLMLKRSYYTNHKLEKNDEKGSVAYHNIFVLNEDNIGNGIAKSLHQSELSVYKNKIDEIQLYAIDDGTISWVRLGFSFVDEDSKYLVYENLMNYLETVKRLPESQLDDIAESFLNDDETINEEVFRTLSKDLYLLENNNFTTWFENLNNDYSEDGEQKPTMKMYKDVA